MAPVAGLWQVAPNRILVSLLLSGLLASWGCSAESPDTSSSKTPQQTVSKIGSPNTGPSGPKPHHIATPDPKDPVLSDQDQAAAAFEKLSQKNISETEWDAAYQQLIDLGTGATQVLGDKLRSPQAYERGWATSILVQNTQAAAQLTQELIACLDDADPHVLENAAAALALIPGHEKQALPVFAKMLTAAETDRRRMAASYFASFGPEASDYLEPLTTALDDPDPQVVLSIIDCLSQIDTPGDPAMEKLRALSKASEDDKVKAAALRAVQQMETASTEPLLIR